MNIAAIQLQIIKNYEQLSELTRTKRNNSDVVPIWGLNYKKNNTYGHVNQMGEIETNRVTIYIANGDTVRLREKPFFYTQKMALKDINNLLKKIITNINNKDVVTKCTVNIHCFPYELLKRLAKKP